MALALPTVAVARAPYFPPELASTYYTFALESGEQSRPVELLSDFESGWFSKHLQAADEPSLYSESQSAKASIQQIIRFTWLRSFHPPVTVRVTADLHNSWRIVAKELSGAGGYEPGEIKRTVTRRLTSKEVADLAALMAQSPLPDASGDCVIGVDGAEWIIERVDREGYHFIRRWSPADGPVRDVGLFLVGLTGWRYKEAY